MPAPFKATPGVAQVSSARQAGTGMEAPKKLDPNLQQVIEQLSEKLSEHHKAIMSDIKLHLSTLNYAYADAPVEEKAIEPISPSVLSSRGANEAKEVVLAQDPDQVAKLLAQDAANASSLASANGTDAIVKSDDAATDEMAQAASASLESDRQRSASRFDKLRNSTRGDFTEPIDEELGCVFVQRMVKNKVFEFGSLIVILLNTMCLAAEVEFMGKVAGHEMKLDKYEEPATDSWQYADEIFPILSVIFNVIFSIELLLRSIALGRTKCCANRWLWLDGILVFAGWIDVFGSYFSLDQGLNATFLRVLRLLRLLRIIKTFKSRSSFHSLFLLMKALQASFNALCWSFLLLFFIMLATGLFINQILYGYFTDSQRSHQERSQVFEYFGTFLTTMITMFEITLGNWVTPTRKLMNADGVYWGIYIVIYRCFFCFAVVNVIRAVFITETNRVALQDDEVAMMNAERATMGVTHKLLDLFHALDVSGDGTIDWNDFQEALTDVTLKEYMKTLELLPKDLQTLFKLLDDGDGYVTTDEFVSGVLALRGQAKCIDMMTLMHVTRTMDKKLDALLPAELVYQSKNRDLNTGKTRVF
jgi:hypothetical protein